MGGPFGGGKLHPATVLYLASCLSFGLPVSTVAGGPFFWFGNGKRPGLGWAGSGAWELSPDLQWNGRQLRSLGTKQASSPDKSSCTGLLVSLSQSLYGLV